MSATQKLLRFGVFELNLATEELRKSETVIKLPPQPLRLLALLASRAGQVVSREEIQQQFWGDETEVDFERRMNQCIAQVRTALGDNAAHPLYVETIHRQGYRFIAPVESTTIAEPPPRVVKSDSPSDVERAIAERVLARITEGAPRGGETRPGENAAAGALQSPFGWLHRRWAWVAVVLVILGGGTWYWRSHTVHALTEKDTIVLADFDNKTGDPVFDETLKQALTIQLEQSPYLNVLSDVRVTGTLKLMDRPAGERLTPEAAREVCLRTNSKAFVAGSIASVGDHYLVTLKVENCQTGDTLASAEAEAENRNRVLKALGNAGNQLRGKLGESLASVQKFNQPLEEATTSSLEALQAFTTGQRMRRVKDESESLPYLKHALELDPNFAYAYVALGSVYSNLGESKLARENYTRAYELRGRVSQRERFIIEGVHYNFTLGDLEMALQTYSQWAQSYPGDYLPHIQMSLTYRWLGQFEKAAAEAQAALRLTPTIAGYFDLMAAYFFMDRLKEAKGTFDDSQAHHFDSAYPRLGRYLVAFLERDDAGMEQQLTWATGKPGEDMLLVTHSDTEAYFGRFAKGAEYTQKAVDISMRNNEQEQAAGAKLDGALREVEVGEAAQARKTAAQTLAMRASKDVLAEAAMTFARGGDIIRAQRIVDQLSLEFPADTLMQRYTLPTIRAAIELQKNNPRQAIEILQVTALYELGWASLANLYPAYVRGEAYLRLGEGQQGAAEFQKMIDHPGVVLNFVTGALAHLQLGRAQAMIGDRPAARKSYEDFFTLWKDADPDIPILKQAKAEYAKLQ